MAAWYLAILLLPSPRPAFASIAAVICLGATHGQRRRRATELVDALRDLYAYTYDAQPAALIAAAALRARAMDVSDRWVAAGADPLHPLLEEERALLVRSYAALLAAVHR